MRQRLLSLPVRRALFGLGVVLQCYILYTPRVPSTGTLPVDKVIHAGMFGGVLWLGALAGIPLRPLIGALCVHAVVSEFIQAWWIRGRDGDWRDVVADLTGVLIVTLLLCRRGREGAPPG